MEEIIQLRSKVASLESKLDFLLAEREHLNSLLLECGFSQGIETLMSTAQEVLQAGGIDAIS
jgi:hypothetical protein